MQRVAKRWRLAVLATVLGSAAWSSAGCATRARELAPHAPHPGAERAGLEVAPFPEGSALFRRDPAWVGADSAYSVSLDPRRVLWLFGDTFIDPRADGVRGNGPSFFVRNSIAIQSGDDPAQATDASRAAIAFRWGPVRDGKPGSFFAEPDGAERWIWPLHGARLPGGPLLLFRMQVERAEGGLGFTVRGWDAVAIDAPERAPDAWRPRVVQALTTTFGVLLGAAVLVHDGFLYAYAVRNDPGDHAVYLARFALSALATLEAGALADPVWYCGAAGFVAETSGARPVALFAGGQTELSVSYDPARARFIEIQMRGVLLADPHTALGYRLAARPEGPFGALHAFYRPPEAERADAAKLAAYAAKAHPEQAGEGLLVSYVVNELGALVPDDALYYPQLVRVHIP